MRPQQWKRQVLTTGPSGNSLIFLTSGSLNVDIFTYIIRKILQLFMSLLISSEKSKYWEIVNLIVVDTSFLEFYSLLESSDFLFGNKYCQLFSWRSDRFTSSFSRKYLSYTQFGIISLSVILSSESYVPWKRQLVQLTTQTKAFPWTNHRILVCSRSALCVLPLHCCHVAVKNKMPTRLAQFGPLSQIVLRHQRF